MSKDISTYIHDGMELTVKDWTGVLPSFDDLASIIQSTHDSAQTSAIKAINRMQTMRNWLVGYYIVEFEQNGKDRAEYGSRLLTRLEERVNRRGLTRNTFQSSRNFYLKYPQMAQNLTAPLRRVDEICTTPSCKLLGFCYVRARARRWWNMHWLAWTTSCLFQHTCFRYQTKRP